MPDPLVTTSTEHWAFSTYRKDPFSVVHCVGKNVRAKTAHQPNLGLNQSEEVGITGRRDIMKIMGYIFEEGPPESWLRQKSLANA